MTDNEVWALTQSQLSATMPEVHFKAYIKPLSLVERVSNGGEVRVVLACRSDFIKGVLEKRYANNLRGAFGQVLNSEVKVDVVVDTKVNDALTAESAPLFAEEIEKKSGLEATLESVGLMIELSLEKYAVSDTNEMAYAAAKAVAKSPGAAYNPLFLYGGVGVGKTHLMQGVGQEILRDNLNLRVIYCTGEEFTNEIIDAIRRKSTPMFRRKYRKIGLLLIDDIQFIAGKTAVQAEFFHTFNAITKEGGQVIMTSDKAPLEIDGLEARLRSRFEGGLTIDIGQPDFELRSAIIMIKARNLGMEMESSIAQLLAESVSDTRALLGSLVKLKALADNKGGVVDAELAMKVLESRANETKEKKVVEPEEVVKQVSEEFGQEVDEVLGKSRVQTLTTPRFMAMMLLKYELKMGYVAIGKRFSGRDHTSVMHGVKKIEGLIKQDKDLEKRAGKLKRGLWG